MEHFSSHVAPMLEAFRDTNEIRLWRSRTCKRGGVLEMVGTREISSDHDRERGVKLGRALDATRATGNSFSATL